MTPHDKYEYHIGLSALTNSVYFGKLVDKKLGNGTVSAWDIRTRKEINIDEVLDAAALYLIRAQEEYHFEYKDKRYALRVTELKEGGEE